MTTNATAIKPSEALKVEVLFPCECGNTDNYIVYLTAHSRAGFDTGTLGSNWGVGGYDGIGVSEVTCISCDKFYQPNEAEVACKAYRVYLDSEGAENKKTTWDNFLDARKKAVKV